MQLLCLRMYLSHGFGRNSHMTLARSGTGGNEALLLRSYTLVLCSFYQSYLCSRLPLSFSEILPFSFFEQSFQVSLVAQDNVQWFDLTCRFLVEHSVVSQLCFPLPFRYQVLCHPQNQYPSAQQLIEKKIESNLNCLLVNLFLWLEFWTHWSHQLMQTKTLVGLLLQP